MKNVVKEIKGQNGSWVLRWSGRMGYTFGFLKAGQQRISGSYQTCLFEQASDKLSAIAYFEKWVSENGAKEAA